MKKIALSLSLLLFISLSSKAETVAEMVEWMNNNSSKIDLDKSRGARSFYFVKSITFSRASAYMKNAEGGESAIDWSSFDKVIQNGSEITVQSFYKDFYLVLSIPDPEYLKKYIQYINACAYARLNTTAEDGQIYSKDQVSQPAAFKGGTQAWNQLLLNSLNLAPAYKYDVSAGLYEAEISFVVTERGYLKDFHRVNNNPKGLDDCLLSLLYRKTQPWIPAQINGKNVASKTSVKVMIKITPETDPMANAHYKSQMDFKLNMANY